MSTTKSLLKRATAYVLAFVMAFSLLFTGNSAITANAAAKVTSIKVAKSKVTLEAGKTANIKVTVKGGNKKFTVKSTKKSVATAKVVGKKVRITAKSAGTATVKVTTKGKNKKGKKLTKKIKVTVTAAATPTPAPTPDPTNNPQDKYNNVTISTSTGGTSVANGQSTKLDVPGVDAADKALVKWESSNSNVASVDTNGNVTGGVAGTATISATMNGKVIGSVTITVSPIPVTGVTIDAANGIKIPIKGKSQLKAIVSPANATNTAVTWTSDKETVAKVDANGVVEGIAAGDANITVKTVDGEKTASVKVTVTSSTDVTEKDGLSIELTSNLLDTYSDPAKSEYVVLSGSRTSARVRLMADGKPLGERQISLEIKSQYGNTPNLYKIKGEKSEEFVTTDANGYAEFPIALTEDYKDVTATSGRFESYILTANYNDLEESATLKFGTVYIESADVLNTYEEYTDDDFNIKVGALKPGTNVPDGQRTVKSVDGTDYQSEQEYVINQQYKNDIMIAAYPVLHLPPSEAAKNTGEYHEAINFTSGSYSVYNDDTNETTTRVIKKVPAGLKYATLIFNSINLSNYTNLKIDFYTLDKDGLRSVAPVRTEYRKPGNIDNTALSVQVPKDFLNNDLQVVVSLVSEGQVELAKSGGYVLDEVVGEWENTLESEWMEVIVDGCVTWEEDTSFNRSSDSAYSLSPAQARLYLPDNEDYFATGLSYVYNVPAFPHVGVAIITVKDANGNDKYYFSYPIKNDEDRTNTYVIADPSYEKAVLIGSQEKGTKVGNLKQTGNVVTVSSTGQGYTPLKATIDISSLGVKKDNIFTSYSSVQWSALARESTQVPATDFYALSKQYVDVTAKLVASDNHSQRVTQEGQEINFELDSDDNLRDYLVDASKFTGRTDENGELRFAVRNNNESDIMSRLMASSPRYDVVFDIGDKTNVECATIHWVEAGLYFKDAADSDTSNGNEYEAYNGTKKADPVNMSRLTGTEWTIAMKTVGKLPLEDRVNGYSVGKLTGITIKYDKTGDASAITSTNNNIYTIKSSNLTTTNVTGTINNSSITDNVQFTIVDIIGDVVGVYNNVGKGTANVSADIEVPLNWVANGIKVEIINPFGEENLYKDTPVTVYVKVTDTENNELSGREVEYRVKGSGNVRDFNNVQFTDSKGLVPIAIGAPGTAGSIEVSANVGSEEAQTLIISYTAPENIDDFVIRSAKADVNNGTVTVTFSNALVEKLATNKDAYELVDAQNNPITISSVAKGAESNQVVITLTKSDTFQNVDVTAFSLTVKPYTSGNMLYQVTDTHYQTLDVTTVNLQ